MDVCATTVQSGTRYEPLFSKESFKSKSVNNNVRAVSKYKQGLHIFPDFAVN